MGTAWLTSRSNNDVESNPCTLPVPLPTRNNHESSGLEECIHACRGGMVILSGCGGGWDVFGTALLLHHLRNVAKDVVLVSLTFTKQPLLEEYAVCITPYLYRVDPEAFCSPLQDESQSTDNEFPEALFATAVGKPVYVLNRHGITASDMMQAYHTLYKMHHCDAVRALFLVETGCDVLLTGDETGLGTPVEDMLHLFVMTQLLAQHKAIVAVGANVDCRHGVLQQELDDRLDALRTSGAMLFERFLSPERDDAKYYCQVVSSQGHPCAVQNMVKAALEGHRGDYTQRTAYGHSLSVPLTDQTATLFGFDLHAIAGDVTYLCKISEAADMTSVMKEIQAYRSNWISKSAVT